MLKKLFGGLKKGKPPSGGAADGAGTERPVEYVYITLSSIYKSLIVLAACLALTFIAAGDLSQTVLTPRPAVKTPAPAPVRTPRPTPEPQDDMAADLSWWAAHEVFSCFPIYNGAGNAEPRFSDGPLFEGGYQYKLSDVSYADYIAYLGLCDESGYKPYDPYGGFVEENEMDNTAQGGYVEFISGGYRMNIYYRAHIKELIFEADKAPAATGVTAGPGVG